jgi:hypothetical protein
MESIKNGIEFVEKAGNFLYDNVKDIRPPHLSTILTLTACSLPGYTAQDNGLGNSTGGETMPLVYIVVLPFLTVASLGIGCCVAPHLIREFNNRFSAQPDGSLPPTDNLNDEHRDLTSSPKNNTESVTQNSVENNKGETSSLLDQPNKSNGYDNGNVKFQSNIYSPYPVSRDDTEIQLFKFDDDD